MGYRIDYTQEVIKTPVQERSMHKPVKRNIWLVIILLLCLGAFWSFRQELRSYILPGDSKKTEAAITAFVDDMRSGATFQDAVMTFCREIIDNA